MAKGEEAFGLDGLERGLGFGRSRRAAECQSEGAVNLVGGIGTGILFQARGKVASLFEHEGVVAEREGLQWRGGGEAFGREVGGIRTIKRGEKFMRRGADDKSINAATPQVGGIRRDVLVNGCVGLGIFEISIARAAALVVELAASG